LSQVLKDKLERARSTLGWGDSDVPDSVKEQVKQFRKIVEMGLESMAG
jgi:hypothetical protein